MSTENDGSKDLAQDTEPPISLAQERATPAGKDPSNFPARRYYVDEELLLAMTRERDRYSETLKAVEERFNSAQKFSVRAEQNEGLGWTIVADRDAFAAENAKPLDSYLVDLINGQLKKVFVARCEPKIGRAYLVTWGSSLTWGKSLQIMYVLDRCGDRVKTQYGWHDWDLWHSCNPDHYGRFVTLPVIGPWFGIFLTWKTES